MTAATKLHYHFQLADVGLGGAAIGPAIVGSGGFCIVTAAAAYAKATLYSNKEGTSKANGFVLSSGSGDFYTDSTVTSVDLYILAPDGQWTVIYGAKPDVLADIPINRGGLYQVMRIPFLGSDYTSATETDTGIVLPTKALVLPDCAVDVVVAQSGKTISVGLLSSQSGGAATGYINAISLTTAGIIAAKSASTATRGSLIGAGTLDTGNAGDLQTAKNISITLGSSQTTCAGVAILPYLNLTKAQPSL